MGEEEVVIEEVGGDTFKGDAAESIGDQATKNAYQASQEKKEFSYYHAHKEKYELPPDTVVRQEDPLLRADGQGVKKLDVQKKINLEKKITWVDSMSFSDDGAVVKLYVEFPGVIKDHKVDCKFDRFSVEMILLAPDSGGRNFGLKIKEQDGWILDHERHDGFSHEIDPEKCKHRIASNGQRVTLTLAKKDDKEKWYELRKKSAQSTIPRENPRR